MLMALYEQPIAGEMSPEEEEEQKRLRKAYIMAIRRNLRGSLDNISIKEADGSITNLGEKHGKKGTSN